MRSARTGLWLAVFLMGASLPAFCQVIVPPNISGRTIATDTGMSQFQEPVYSTGTFEASLAVLKNSQMKFYGSGVVCTTGPVTTVSFNIPFNQFGLTAGDSITFLFRVKHGSTEGGTASYAVTVIPVVQGSTTPPPPPPPPPPTSKLWGSTDSASALAAARKEEMSL
jgi:hypothetical protein